MSGQLNSARCAAVVLPDEPALVGERVGVNPGLGISGPAILTVAGRLGQASIGVNVVPHQDVPSDLVVLTESLADRLGFTPDTGWTLTPRPAGPIHTLTLEAMVEEPAQQAWRAVQEDVTLAGRCLWTGGGVDSCVVELGGRRFRVRSIDGRADRGELRVVDANTVIELFVPGSRVGLDVVILADQSGSMGVDDLPASSERVGWSWRSTKAYQRRIDALQDALRQMLQARLRISGRESRLALLSFNDQTWQLFPQHEGMIALDGDSPPTLVNAFVSAVDHMYPTGGTNIEGALLRAAEVLDAHGVPGNDRLIVLVSDGKAWTPKGSASTGEVVWAREDPVSLMSHCTGSARSACTPLGSRTRPSTEIGRAETTSWSRRTSAPITHFSSSSSRLVAAIPLGLVAWMSWRRTFRA